MYGTNKIMFHKFNQKYYFCKKIIMNRYIFLSISFFLVLNVGVSQSLDIRYQIEPDIEKVLELHKTSWNHVKKVEGYRIQIVALAGSNSRINAETTKKNFTKAFPKVSCYLSYFEPNFRVRVGDFRNRIDAIRILNEIQILFPGAFVVRDKVNYTDL